MATILLVLQIFIVLALVTVILIQKTGADGLSGLSGGGHNFISGRTASNVFVRTTAILAIAFMVNSLVLARISAQAHKKEKGIIESISETESGQHEHKEVQVPSNQ